MRISEELTIKVPREVIGWALETLKVLDKEAYRIQHLPIEQLETTLVIAKRVAQVHTLCADLLRQLSPPDYIGNVQAGGSVTT